MLFLEHLLCARHEAYVALCNSLYPLILPFFQLKKLKLREVKGLVQVTQLGTQGNRIQIHARGQVLDVCTERGLERLGRRSGSHS